MTTEEKLEWLEKHQPRNIVAINALRSKLGKKLVYQEPKHVGFQITPYLFWKNRGKSSN